MDILGQLALISSQLVITYYPYSCHVWSAQGSSGVSRLPIQGWL